MLPDAALGCRPADMGGGNDASCVDKGVLEVLDATPKLSHAVARADVDKRLTAVVFI